MNLGPWHSAATRAGVPECDVLRQGELEHESVTVPVFGYEPDPAGARESARGRLDATGEHTEQRVLPGSFDASDSYELARAHREGDPKRFSTLRVVGDDVVEHSHQLAWRRPRRPGGGVRRGRA
jgi:hypothetical protein